MNDMQIFNGIDIHTGVQTAFVITLMLGLLSLLQGFRTVRSGARLQFFRKRHDRMVAGWRMIVVGVVFVFMSYLMNTFAEPIAYKVYPPSPTITLTPTVTLTPTISVTPTITLTPTITNTPSVTNTPSMPKEVETQFVSTITPAATPPVFSPLVFAQALDDSYQPVEPAEEFTNPIKKMYGVFSYDQMTTGAQWTALWYRNGELVFYETVPWTWGSGGYGYTEWAPSPDQWHPGTYEVQIFVGNIWIEQATSYFTVVGEAPTAAPTLTPTNTPSPTNTIGPSPTFTPSPTPTVTLTLVPSNTPTITLSPTPTMTRIPSQTPTNTPTLKPTRTPRPTDTKRPTPTPDK